MGLVVVGAGHWGKNHVRTLSEMGELVGVCDTDANKLAYISKDVGEIEFKSDLDDAITCWGHMAEGFVVSTNTETHLKVAKKLLSLGFPTLVEKPVALKSSQLQRLIDDIPDASRLLMAGHITLFNEGFSVLNDALTERDRIYSMSSTRLQQGKHRNEGVIYSLGIHDLAVLQVLIGSTHFNKIEWDVVAPRGWADDVLHTTNVIGRSEDIAYSGTWSYYGPFVQRTTMFNINNLLYAYNEERGKTVLKVLPHILQKRNVNEVLDHGVNNIEEHTFLEEPLAVELDHFLTSIRNGDDFCSGMGHLMDVTVAAETLMNKAKEQR